MQTQKWKRIIGWTVATLILVGIIGGNIYQQQKDKRFSICINVPLSGGIGTIGQAYVNGLKLGIQDELSENHLDPSTIKLNINDNQGKPSEAVSIYQNHAAFGYDVYVSGTAEMSNALIPIMDKTKPHFLFSLDEEATSLSPNNIRIYMNFNLEGKSAISFLKKKNPQKVFLIAGCPACQRFLDKSIIPYIRDNQIDYKRENFENGFKEFRSISQKALVYKPDAIIIDAYGTELLGMLRSLKEYGLIKQGNTWTTIDLIDLIDAKIDQEITQDIVFDAMYFNILPDKAFIEHYQKKFNKMPIYTSAYGYDTGRLIVKAFIKNGNVDVTGILEQTPYDGVSGKIELDQKTRDLKSTLIRAILSKDGKIIPVESEVP